MSVTENTKHLAPAGTWAPTRSTRNVSFEVDYAGVNTLPRRLHAISRPRSPATRSRARRRSRPST